MSPLSVVSFNDIRFVSYIVLKFVGASSKHIRAFHGSLRQSSEIFGHLRKFLGNVQKRSSGIQNNFGKTSEIFGRGSEIFRKSSKTPSSACLYNKKNITPQLEDMNFIFGNQSFRLQVDSPTSRSFRLHDQSCFAYTV